jgi:hypothetical protein
MKSPERLKLQMWLMTNGPALSKDQCTVHQAASRAETALKFPVSVGEMRTAHNAMTQAGIPSEWKPVQGRGGQIAAANRKARIADLEKRVDRLESRIVALEAALGVDTPQV